MNRLIKIAISSVGTCTALLACLGDTVARSDNPDRPSASSKKETEIAAGTPESEKAMRTFSSLSFLPDLKPLDEFLIQHPELINRSAFHNLEGQTVLFTAASQNRVEVVELLLSHKADWTLPCPLSGNRTPFSEAARQGHLDTVKVFVRHGVDINHQNPAASENHVPMSALDQACEHGRLEVAKFLIEKGAKLDSNPFEARFPAIHHAMRGSVTLTRLSGPGLPPLPPLDNSEIVELLLSHGADLATYNLHGDQALHVAIKGPAPHTVKYLLEKHRQELEIDCRGQNGWTPLMMAAMNARASKVRPRSDLPSLPTEFVVKLLLDHGADKAILTEPNDRGLRGKTAYDFAVQFKAAPTVLDLLKP